jgi:hypothetical protein
MLVQTVGVDDLARVHLPVGVPDQLELPHRVEQLLAVLLAQQLGPLLAVAVLAGERAAVAHDEVRGFLGEPVELPDPGGGDEVELDAGVHAALAEVPVHGAAVVVLVIQRAQVADIVAERLGRDRGVLPPRPVVLAIGWEGRRPEAALADVPQIAAVPALLLGTNDLDPVRLVALLVDQPIPETRRRLL